MKKTRLITVLTVAAMLYATCETAFSVELNLKNLKDAAKKELDQKRGAKKDGSEKENSEKQEPASANSSSTADNKKPAASANKVAVANTEPNSEDDFDWEVNDDFTEITITKYKGTRKDVVIPASIQDVPVVCIGEKAFVSAKISSVIVPDSVKTIKDGYHCFDGTVGPFYQSELESVTLPKGINIWGAAFYDCTKLVSVTLGENTTIGRSTFAGCTKLVSVTLGENTTIGDGAFHSCKSLENIDIPKGCTLNERAFYGCKKLASVSLPEDLKMIPRSCFEDCALTSIEFPSTVKYIREKAFMHCPLESVNLQEGLEFLEVSVFDSDKIASVTFPKSLKWISTKQSGIREEVIKLITGDNISNITIAEGCSPKIISNYDKEAYDGRDIIKGAMIDKSIKLQKMLASWKLQGCYATKRLNRYDDNEDYDFERSYRYKFTEEGKALYADLLSYGFSEEEAQAICAESSY